MNNRDIVIGAIGITIVVGQLYTIGKIISVDAKVETTTQQFESIKSEVGNVIKEVGSVKTKVDELEKIVLYRIPIKLQVSQKDMHCLTKNIYHEAGVEDRPGKIAVAQVTLNRLQTKRWGNSICSVVYAKAQFSWTLEKKKRWSKPKGELWNQSVAVANEFVQGKRVKGIEKSKFYHTDYIRKPTWAKTMVQVKQIGQHIFYSET